MLLGESKAITALNARIARAAQFPAHVLILGEPGTGKELVARLLHQLGPHKEQPFIAVNCAAIPSELMEAELFGYERGAFTGAAARTLGCFEQAGEGTLFLDEIGEMPVGLQAKMLRVLQTGEYRRIGSSQTRVTACRVVSATNKQIHAGVNFRADLYSRLSTLILHTPPLREHKEDIPILLKRNEMTVPPEALDVFMRHTWPGNVRELENVCDRLVAFATEITAEAVREAIDVDRTFQAPEAPNVLLAVLERIATALEKGYLIPSPPSPAPSPSPSSSPHDTLPADTVCLPFPAEDELDLSAAPPSDYIVLESDGVHQLIQRHDGSIECVSV